MVASQRFTREHRLRRNVDFQRVYQRRQSVSDGSLLVFGCENGFAHPRLGLSVSRKVGGAVVRNRWKRRLREAFRLSLAVLPAGVDLVVIPRGAAEPDLDELIRSLMRAAGRLAAKLKKSTR